MLPFTVRAARVGEKENQDQLAPIKIIVTISGKRSYRSIGERVLLKDWNEDEQLVRKSHPKHQLINAKIKSEISRIEDDLRKKQITGDPISVKSYKHPSGVAVPSQADVELTKQVYMAGKILNIELLDHLIITADDYLSFAKEGLI
jgi:hypothetical protein